MSLTSIIRNRLGRTGRGALTRQDMTAIINALDARRSSPGSLEDELAETRIQLATAMQDAQDAKAALFAAQIQASYWRSRAEKSTSAPSDEPSPDERSLRGLLAMCHPDKLFGKSVSDLANEMTKRINEMRGKTKAGVQARRAEGTAKQAAGGW